uniref:Aryl hydrocarbon receptor-like n=1 Tax=Gouania willdenowi TaxID=441366 RepID=A0A8C5DXU4_GOUWI
KSKSTPQNTKTKYLKKASGVKDAGKSNPSKRHRDRLNAELDWLLDLLPFNQDVRSGLDKLSVLRLSVGYLRAKSHFTGELLHLGCHLSEKKIRDTHGTCLPLQALNGFVMVVSSDGLVFYVSSTIKDYLGFSQSDVLHQSVYELIHTDDRLAFREQLSAEGNTSLCLTLIGSVLYCGSCGSVTFDPEQLTSESCSLQMRSFVCRFRCLLDNSSGFLALKVSGRLRFLHGLNGGGKQRPPQPALFMVASPVQPPSIVEIRAKLLLYQTKHQLDFTPVDIDSRGQSILGYSEEELRSKGSGYQFIHAADMMYCADRHLRMMKTGESGHTIFRLLSKSQSWIWVKSNAKMIFKGGQPQFIIAYQKALTGEAYLRQRRLELPFNSTTGEGVLYNTGATVDITHLQFNKRFGDDMRNDVAPGSLLDCFLNQDEKNLYSQTVETHLPLDQIFMDSHALVSVQSSSWQEDTAAPEELVKEEPQEAEGETMDCLDDRTLDELEELENALRHLGQENRRPGTSNMFNFIDTILFRQSGKFGTSVHPSCLAGLQDNPMEVPPSCGLQLDDIFSPSIELPELLLPEDQHLPQNHLQAPPLNHLQAPPLNHFQVPPLNHIQTPPPGFLQALPPNHIQAPPLNYLQAPPPNHIQAPPLNYLQALPPNNIQAPPQNHLQAPPPNHIQAPPLNHLQAPPPHHIQAPPLNHLQAPPPNNIWAPLLNHPQAPPPTASGLRPQTTFRPCPQTLSRLQVWRWDCSAAPQTRVPSLIPCQDFGSSNGPLPVSAADPSHWLVNGHEATPHTPAAAERALPLHSAVSDPLQSSAYFQWK